MVESLANLQGVDDLHPLIDEAKVAIAREERLGSMALPVFEDALERVRTDVGAASNLEKLIAWCEPGGDTDFREVLLGALEDVKSDTILRLAPPVPRKVDTLLEVAKGAWNGACNARGLLRSLGLALDSHPAKMTNEDFADVCTVVDHVHSIIRRPEEVAGGLAARYEGGTK